MPPVGPARREPGTTREFDVIRRSLRDGGGRLSLLKKRLCVSDIDTKGWLGDEAAIRAGWRCEKGPWHGDRRGMAWRDGEGQAPSLHQPAGRPGGSGTAHRAGGCGRASHGSGATSYLVTAGVLIAIILPLVYVLVIISDRQQRKTDDKVRELTHELSAAIELADREGETREVQGQRQRFESRLANALDMAEGEPEVIDVIERSFAAVVPNAPVELLLADNSHAHLLRMAGVGPDGEPPSCSVDSPDRCPAARRAQTQVFADSDHLDACPKLRNRPQGRLSALCVPVSIMGRTVGVIHATDKPMAEVQDPQVQDLTTLAKLAGARIGLLRVMAETQLQASTDTLTGLLNRRSFSEKGPACRTASIRWRLRWPTSTTSRT